MSRLVVTIAVLTLAAPGNGPAYAQQAKKPAKPAPHTAAKPAPKPADPAKVREAVQGVHQAIAQLIRAKHDYAGHRAQAVKLLHETVRELQPGTPEGKNTGVALTETQAQSDAQLREALRILGNTTAVVNGMTHAHPKAHKHFHEAIHELNVALKIR